MNYLFFTANDYVDQNIHISAVEKSIYGKTDFHTHDFFEIEIVISGSGRQIINGVEYKLERGTISLLSPGIFHRMFCEPELKLITIMFDESMIENELIPELLAKFQDRCFKMNEDEFFEVYTLATQLIDHINDKYNYNNLYVRNLLNCIIIKIIQSECTFDTIGNEERFMLLNNAMRYLYNNFKDDPPLKKTASLFGYTPNYFSKIFSELTGKGYVDFLNALKTMHAKMLLLSSDKTVSEIAFLCGFSSISNFYRVFKKETGISPLDCRKRNI